MATTVVTDYEDYKILNAHVRLWDSETQTLGEAKELGCTGVLTVESELKTISKVCSGETMKEVVKATKLNGTVNAHVKPDVAIDVLGLTNDGLKTGIYGYNGSKTARGVLTLDVVDMYEEQKKLLAFPEINFNSGLKLDIQSGEEEIAMMELTFTGTKDDNGYYYYQAYEADITDEAVKATWHTAFDADLVAATPVVP